MSETQTEQNSAAHPLANSGNVSGFDLAHYVGRGDPRHDGPYLDDVHAAQEDQYREARTASMKRTDEALENVEGGLVGLDREREIQRLRKQAEDVQNSHEAQKQAEENSREDQVPLGVAQNPEWLERWNNGDRDFGSRAGSNQPAPTQVPDATDEDLNDEDPDLSDTDDSDFTPPGLGSENSTDAENE